MSKLDLKIANIADGLRSLSGTTIPMSIEDMSVCLIESNSIVSHQADLLEQVKDALLKKFGKQG